VTFRRSFRIAIQISESSGLENQPIPAYLPGHAPAHFPALIPTHATKVRAKAAATIGQPERATHQGSCKNRT
jgi:hypothetical protein